jgi:CheY-like chemotaxis protein
MNVLVVDNNQINREILSEMIANWWMHAVPAEGGAEALMLLEGAHASGESFPVVILDALMPGISGFDVLERIQSQPGLAGSVIMLLSANQLMADTARCRDLGVQRCLTKPVGQSELLDAILMTLGQRASAQSAPPVPTRAPEKKIARVLNILLSEDNPVNQKLAIRLLEKAGHRVTLASTGREALAAWEKAEPPGFDVLLMDIQMPEMDGMEATAAIRDREKKLKRRVPIIAMTAHAMRGDREKCLAAGMDGYVSKPINSAELFAEIDRCVAAPEGGTTVPEKPEVDTEGQVDRASLLERVEGDQELLSEMIHMFLDDVPNLIAAMRDALQRGDMKVLERSAHSVKGAAANLSARAASAAALQLEQDARNNDAEAARGSLLEVERTIRRLLPALAELSPGVTK